jgi:hypothetical protein
MNRDLIFFPEPNLLFGHNQRALDPKDGLTLFGPYESLVPHTLQIGVIGTQTGVDLYKQFVNRLHTPIISEDHRKRASFPGFGAVYGVTWPSSPAYESILNESDINQILEVENVYERTFRVVSLYLDSIEKIHREEERSLDLWFVVVPRQVWLRCRPKSPSSDAAIPDIDNIRAFRDGQGILFSDMEADYEEYSQMLDTSSDFHDQMKARLLERNLVIPIQIILEPTLCFRDKYHGFEYRKEQMKAHLAWTQSATMYYKLGMLPWKLADIRKGVCYVGLVFKQFEHGKIANRGYACSAAQMFLDSGDGTIFRGNIGPWKSGELNEYHLDQTAAKELLTMALDSYLQKNGYYPDEVFLHGRASFKNREWEGFERAISEAGANTKLVGVVIKSSSKLKLFRDIEGQACKYGNLRGLALPVSDKEAFCWTRGYIPKLNTSNCQEIANPLRIIIDKGDADLNQIIYDIICLTKLNYNACIYGDGLPVTLRFSDMIGSILTAVDKIGNRVLPFKYYI